MQDRYTGDVGDFAKYGLLRHLLQARCHNQLRLGVIWYLVDDESGNSDGRHISYLFDGRMHLCDPSLHQAMAGLVSTGTRSVVAVERSAILPADRTIYYSERLPPVSGRSGLDSSARLNARMAWFERAKAAVAGCDLVFLDPDNGLEAASVAYSAKKAGKYAYMCEVRALVAREQTVIIYQHHDRSAPVHTQVERLVERLKLEIANHSETIAATFRKGSARTFLILLSHRHRGVVQKRLDQMRDSPWGAYFRLFQ